MSNDAVRVPIAQAAEFEERYRALAKNPYRSTFTYGRMKIEQLLDRELARFPLGARALDVGCGTGFNVGRLLDRGFVVSGIEPSVAMRQHAIRDNPRAEILDGDVTAIPFDSDRFDVVVCIEVLRYLNDSAVALAEMHRVLAPEGLAFVTAAPALSLNGYAVINQVTARLRVPTFTKVKHSFMTARSARDAMERAGFRDVAVHGAFIGPWHALGRLSSAALAVVLRALEPIDDRLSDLGPLRDLSNHLILVGTK